MNFIIMLLKDKRIKYLIIVCSLFLSCSNNSTKFNSYKEQIYTEISIENKFNDIKLEENFYHKINSSENFNRVQNIEETKIVYNELNQKIFQIKGYDRLALTEIKDSMLCLICNYSYGNLEFYIDLKNNLNSNINPKDTNIVNHIVKVYELLNGNNNHLIIQTNLKILNQLVYEKILGRHEPIGFYFNKITFEILSKESIYFQNEKAYIIPSFIADYKDEKFDIFLFKENSDEYIMEKGVKKLFQNPVSYTASKEEGLHEIKGEIMVMMKGKAVPIPFSFRYYVQAN